MDTFLELRNIYPLQHFKTIRFTTEYPARLIGNLIYLREEYEGYNLINGDSIDSAILKGIRSFAANADFNYQTTLLTKQEFEHALHISRGGVEKEIIFYFFPLTDYDTYTKLYKEGELKAIPKGLKATFWSDDNNLVNSSIQAELLVKLPLDDMKLLDTLKFV